MSSSDDSSLVPSSSSRKSEDPSSKSKDLSSDDPSSSSGSDGATGKCCAYSWDFVLTSETFERGSDAEDDARGWLDQQRQLNGKGFLYHGPIRLFAGDYFAAVLCLGEVDSDGKCECFTEQADQQQLYICTEGVDESYCFYLGGVPGTGIFSPGETCWCTETPGCTECTDDAPAPCKLGCFDCSCCANVTQLAQEPGTVCQDAYVLYSYEYVMKWFPEIFDDDIKQCSTNPQHADHEGNPWQRFLAGTLDQGFNIFLVFYNTGTGEKDAGGNWICEIDENGDPVQNCVIDIWAKDRGNNPDECQPFIFKQSGWKYDDNAELINGWHQTNRRPACVASEAIDGKTCWDTARLEEIGAARGTFRGTLDCVTATYMGSSANWSPLEGDNIGGCGEYSCAPECDQDSLPVNIPPGGSAQNPQEGGNINEDTGEEVYWAYFVERGIVGPPGFVWPEGMPESLGVPGTDWYWYEESLYIFEYKFDADFNDSITDFECKKWTLAVCNRDAREIEDQTPGCGTFTAFDCEGEPFELNMCEWKYGQTLASTSEGELVCTDLSEKPDLGELGEGVPECGQWASSVFPIPLPEKEYDGCPDSRTVNYLQERMVPETKQAGGTGTELTKLLQFFGINAAEKGCKCKSRAAKMDKNGVEWCSNNIEKILDWLQEESQRRKLPFLRTAARVIVLRAIRNARLKGFE